jgi:hypothetical protein
MRQVTGKGYKRASSLGAKTVERDIVAIIDWNPN